MDKNEEIRRELLDFFSLNKISVSNQYEVTKFLNGETEFSLDEIQKIIDNETDKIEKRKTRESLHEKIVGDHVKNNKYKLDKSNIDYNLAELTPQDEYKINIDLIQLEEPVSGKPTNITNITNNTNKHDVAFNNNDMFRFSNGTSETRATHFVLEGKGYTTLETPAYIQEQNIISNEGLQVSLQDELSNRSVHYAKGQANRTGDRPVIIEGEIPAQYVFDNYEHEGEYSIPKEYYNKIENAIIKDAETQTPLYSFNKKDGLEKLDTYTDYNYPELKIKSEDTISQLKNRLNITENVNNELQKELIEATWENSNLDELSKKLGKNYLNDVLFDYSDEEIEQLYKNKSIQEIEKEIQNNFLNFPKDKIRIEDYNGDFNKAIKSAIEQSPLSNFMDDRKIENATKVYSKVAFSDESKNMILDFLHNDKKIDNEKFLEANAKGLEGQYINHSLYEYNKRDLSKSNYDNSIIKDRLANIVNNPEYEIEATSKSYAIGDIGITSKVKDVKYAYYDQDFSDSTLAEDLMAIYEADDRTSKIVTTIEKPERLWAKEYFYEENKDFIKSLMNDNDIQTLDIISARGLQKDITDKEIRTITLSDLTKEIESDLSKPKKLYRAMGLDEFYLLENNKNSLVNNHIWEAETNSIGFCFIDSNIDRKNFFEVLPSYGDRNVLVEFLVDDPNEIKKGYGIYADLGKITEYSATDYQHLTPLRYTSYSDKDFEKAIEFIPNSDNKNYFKIKEIVDPENEKVLFQGRSVNEYNKPKISNELENIENIITQEDTLSFTNKLDDISKNLDDYLNNKKETSKITSQEAFDKYGPNDDRFYTSQGLDSKEQKEITEKLNSKRKSVLSNEEISNQLHKESEEAASQFVETSKELESKKIKQKPKAKSVKPKAKIKENINTKNIISNEAKELEKQVSKSSNLQNKTIQNTAKKSLNTKELGLLAAGAVLLAGTAGIIAQNGKKKKKEEKESNQQHGKYSDIDYDNDLYYANQITNFSRGHSTYSLR